MSRLRNVPPARRVLVTGVGSRGGRAALGALRCRGYEVVGCDTDPLEPDGPWFARVPPAGEPDFAAALTRVAEERELTWLLPTLPEELPVIAAHAESLRALGLAVYVAPARAVEVCRDKWLTAMWLAAHGIAVPRSTVTDPVAHGALGFRDAVITRRRVTPARPEAALSRDDILWQEFLPGDEFQVLAILDPRHPQQVVHARTLAGVTGRQGRATANVTACVASLPAVTELAIGACRSLGLSGPVSVDVRCDAKGRPHVIQVHAHVGAIFGVLPSVFDHLVHLHVSGFRG